MVRAWGQVLSPSARCSAILALFLMGSFIIRGGTRYPFMNENENLSRESPDPRYGSWKFIEEITIEDLVANPVWGWCMTLGLPDEEDGPIGGNEGSMRPLLGCSEVPLEKTALPLILLKIEGTDLYASGLFDIKDHSLDALGIQDSTPDLLIDLCPNPPIYVAVPKILGIGGVRFQETERGARTAKRTN